MKVNALRPLTGFTVLVTRPAGQAGGLCELITEAGGEAIQAPLLSIEPIEDPSAALALLNPSIAWDWLIFVSANAVRFAAALGGWTWRDAGNSRIAAVGEATAAALAAAGFQVDLVPDPPFDSESLLADPRLAGVQGQRLLIVRGEGGREHLADVLRERGAEVGYAEVYRRVPVPAAQFLPVLAGWPEIRHDAVVITSGEALHRLTELLRESGLDSLPRPPLVVPGERLASIAREQGWRLVLVAEHAGGEAIVQTLKQLAHARKTGQGPVALLTRTAIAANTPVPLAAPLIQPYQEHPVASVQAPDVTADQPIIEGDTPLTSQEKDMPLAHEPDLDTETKIPTAEAGTSTSPPVKKGRSLAWVGYMILLGVVALAVGGWFLLQELRSRQEGLGGQMSDKSQQVQEVTHQLTSVQSELAALHSQLATVQSQLSSDDAQLQRLLAEQGDQFEAKLGATRAELTTTIQQIQRQLNQTRGDVLIADAEYLLDVANQKLHLVGDVKSVLAAMEAADQRLHASADPAVFKVREVLAGEIAAIRAMSAPDVVGVSSRLIALEKKVPGLPLVLPHAGTVKEHEKLKEQADAQAPEEKGDALDSTLRSFKDLVTVRRTDRPIEAVLAPEQAEALRQLLLLKLETTRAALLRNDEQLYRDSLSSAMEWVGQHFDGTATETRAVLDELKALAERSLSVTYPDISKSMVLLQNIEKLRLEAEDAALRGKQEPVPPPATVLPPAAPEITPPAEVPVEGKAGTTQKPPSGKKAKPGAAPKTAAPSAAVKPVAPAPPATETEPVLPEPPAPEAKPAAETEERL
ncbi:MAG: fused uroporphyrinogen-III synthase HemD/membrane protein HemX [Methylococcaceae bacterium]|nr:fused uroporphyrinogen-III synthase HemD/membrane protein HemX [Methylococcaceae bacterium]